MKLRSFMFGGVGLIALAATALAAEPAVPAVTGQSNIPVAQTQDNGNSMNTPVTASPATSRDVTMPDATAAAAMGGPIPITSVSNATTTLKSVWVEDSAGKKVGKVIMVRLDANGQPFSLDVMIEDKLVALDVAKAAYDPVNKVVETHLSHAELKSLPPPSAVTMPPATPKPY